MHSSSGYQFEWDTDKEMQNIKKHGVSFHKAIGIFIDPQIIHLEDVRHSSEEDRYYAVGRIKSGEIIIVRYTWRKKVIRIFRAARWRK